ncbi:MAG: phosphatase PAP2 family protein [Erysipelotrichaceae bacterium]|nr:phosphatase PAP2 family protein [Erysipelotrichaceae bacterium]
MIELLLELEIKISIFIQNLFIETPLYDVILFLNNGFSFLGESLVAFLITCFIYFCVNKEKGKLVCFALLSTSITNSMIKNIFRRKRPYLCCEEIELLREVDGYSFPSGHSSNSSCLYILLYRLFENKYTKTIALVFPIVVALSRIFLGAHFLTDVIAGLLLGYIMMAISLWLYSKNYQGKAMLIFLFVFSLGMFYCDSSDYYSAYGLYLGLFVSDIFEKKYVNFTISQNKKVNLYRFIGAIILFVVLNLAIKFLFDFVNFYQMIFRTVRYFILIFIIMGVYPLFFKKY